MTGAHLLEVFNVYLPHTYCLLLPSYRASIKKGVTFRTATPSNSLLWDITLDMGADGAIAVICQRKAPIPGKRQVSLILHTILHHNICAPVVPLHIFISLSE